MAAGRRRYLTAGACAALVLLVWLLWPARRPSVILISIGALRPDFLSCYGGGHAPTPHLDAVAAAGVTFTQAVADAPWERASVASLLTGRYAGTQGVRSPFDRLPETNATMAAVFAAAGYHTGAVVSDFDLDHIFRLDEGFQSFDDRYTSPVRSDGVAPVLHLASIFFGDAPQDRTFRRRKLEADSRRDDADVTDAAIGWLRRLGAPPFFLWVHYFGPRPDPRADAGEVMTRAYEGAVQRVDAEVGRLLGTVNEMQLDRDTIIIVHADHGVTLRERDRAWPGGDLYETSIRVPLMMCWRGRLPAGARHDAMVRLIDILPTLAELTGVTLPGPVDGRSLVGPLRGAKGAGALEAYSETYLPATAGASQTARGPDEGVLHFGFVRRGLRTPRWKYIRSEPSALIDVRPAAAGGPPPGLGPVEELYDLSRDPGETDNLVSRDPTTVATLRAALERYAGRSTP